MIRVALVDDHPLVRAGLAGLLGGLDDIDVVGQASDGADAVDLVRSTGPDVLLMDLSMPGVDGIDATRAVRAEFAELPVLILTSSREGAQLRAALEAGATGYLVKDAEPDEIATAVRRAAAGDSPIDPQMTRGLFPAATDAAPPGAPPGPAGPGAPGGTPGETALVRGREAEVLRLVARGYANKQIATSLGIAERTVKVHLGSVFRRIGVADRTSAALWAREHGY